MIYSEIVKYFSGFLLFAYVILLLKEETHMLQLNSYFNSRYIKWLRENFVSRFGKIKLAIIFFSAFFSLFNPLVFPILLILATLWGIIELITKKAKKKLDFTPRAIRLFSIEIAIVLFIIGCVFFSANSINIEVSILLFVIIFPFLVLLIANGIASPFEALINKWYVNDAKRKISKHTDLIKIGITGSYGKTSVKHFLHKILSEKYNVLMTPGSFNTTMGVVRTIREYLQPNHELFIVEMGAKRIGDIKEICNIVDPRYGILTSVGPQHLESFGSLENIKVAKLEIINCLTTGGVGFVNLDSINSNELPKSLRAKIISFSINSNSDYKAINIAYRGVGMV